MLNPNLHTCVTWSSSPPRPCLRSDEVHVWFIALGISSERMHALTKVLSEEERQRAARFHFERDQRRYIAARATLRRILGMYLDVAPEEVGFTYATHGKPAVQAREPDCTLRFNLSHTHESALVAVTSGREVGVDIEHFSRVVDAKGIVERFFAASEQQMYASAPHDARQALFLRYWTCKEAFAKATGRGLSYPLKEIEVLLTADTPARLAPTVSSAPQERQWTLHELRPAHDYFGAFVVEGQDDFQTRFWQAR